MREMVLKLVQNISRRISDKPGDAASVSGAVEAAKCSVAFVTKDPNDGKLILDYLHPGLQKGCNTEFHDILRKAA